MKTISLAIAAAAALALGSAATAWAEAGSQLAAETASAKAAKGEAERLICRSEENLGSRLIRRRVCLTAEQWKEKHREQREFTDEIQAGAWGAQSDPMVETRMPGAPN